jgi:hypothetical protein
MHIGTILDASERALRAVMCSHPQLLTVDAVRSPCCGQLVDNLWIQISNSVRTATASSLYSNCLIAQDRALWCGVEALTHDQSMKPEDFTATQQHTERVGRLPAVQQQHH